MRKRIELLTKRNYLTVLKRILDFKTLRVDQPKRTDIHRRDFSEFSLRAQKKHSSLW